MRAVLLNPGELARRLEAAGVPVVVVSEAGRRFSALVAAVRRQLADADLVHAHRYKENLLAALSGRPWVATQHGRPERGMAELRSAVYRGLDRAAQRLSARRVIAVSAEVEAWDEGRAADASRAARSRYLAAFTADRAATRTVSVYRAALGLAR